ncbi:amino acid adenylation domain-containing protein [Streptomyces sp. NPDC018026]|uniref:amino acid adenylation domain-containing protein n=1 Tax=Streptomyces sp. NPDC018026 TaxID=3365031 RepID=UPI0037A56346
MPNPTLALDAAVMADVAAVARVCAAAEPAVLAAAVCATLYRYDVGETYEVFLGGTGATTMGPMDRPALLRLSVSGDEPFAALCARAGEPTPGDGVPGATVRIETGAGGDISGVAVVTAKALGEDTGASLPRALRCLVRDALSKPRTRIAALRLQPPDAARAQADRTNRGAEAPPEHRLLHHMFERTAAEYPDRPALVTDHGTMSYGALDARANRLAARLRALGAGPERTIGIRLDRSPALVVGLLAVLKSGSAFVPLDRRLPPDRMRAVLCAADSALVLCHEEQGADPDALGVPTVTVADDGAGPPGPMDGASTPAAAPASRPSNAALLYFTSGSTGMPKGVVIDHRNAANRVDWIARRYGMGPDTVVLHKTPLIFDVAVIEILAPLAAGGAVRLAAPGGEADTGHLAEILRTGGVTFVHFVPSMLKTFLSAVGDAAFPGVRWVQTSGEAMPARLLEPVRRAFPNARFHSAYGQTETSEVAVWEAGTATAPHVPVGEQVGPYRLHVLDDSLNPVPPGVPGEICVAGVGGLARGYHGMPAATAERFVPHPYALEPGERLYRTGDLAVVTADGSLEFRGRRDTQVKLRGARVELAEVEAVLAADPQVRDCAVVVREDDGGDPELVAYVLGPGARVDDLARRAAGALPEYMLPSAYVTMDEFPHTASGKLDRVALPAPTAAQRTARGRGEAPLSSLEAELSSLWSAVLGVDEVGRTDPFFAIGGNSLKAAQVLGRITTLFGVRVPVAAFFADPTVRGLTTEIERLVAELVAALPEDEAVRRIDALKE